LGLLSEFLPQASVARVQFEMTKRRDPDQCDRLSQHLVETSKEQNQLPSYIKYKKSSINIADFLFAYRYCLYVLFQLAKKCNFHSIFIDF